jgi:hypothetical protein
MCDYSIFPRPVAFLRKSDAQAEAKFQGPGYTVIRCLIVEDE